MPSQTIQLSDSDNAFIEHAIQENGYASASDVLHDALRLLEDQLGEEKAKLERFRQLAKEGFDDLDAGRYTTYTRETLHELFDEVDAEVRAKLGL